MELAARRERAAPFAKEKEEKKKKMSNVLSRPPTMLSNLPNLLSPPTTTTFTSPDRLWTSTDNGYVAD